MSTKQTFECEHCGKSYNTYYVTKNRYCSRSCQKAATEKRNTRQCEQCGQLFVWSRAGLGKFCSHACSCKSLVGKSERPSAMIDMQCPNCLTPMSIHPSRAKATETPCCSVECRVEWRKKNATCVTVACLQCEKEFSAPKSQKRKYCSQECATDAIRLPQTTCEHCGKGYSKIYQARTNYCSIECQKAETEARHRRKCFFCGKEFVKSSASSGKFCSHECYGESLKGKKPHNFDQVEKICKNCGTAYLVARGYATSTYCSLKCAGMARQEKFTKTCIGCGIDFVVYRSQLKRQYCSHKCHGKNVRGVSSPFWKGGIRRYYYGPNWQEQRDQARERDKHTCCHCGQKHKKGKRQFDVHHIVPFRTFGYIRGKNDHYLAANDLTNLITLCLSCHVRAENGKIAFQPKLL